MANLKEIRNRITSIKSMKMVSAAKLKKAQDAITAMRPYSSKLTELLQSLSATLDSDAGGAYSTQREVITFDSVAVIAEKLMNVFIDGSYDKIELVYNQFKNAATQIAQLEQFLPIEEIESDKEVSLDYVFEPSKEEIILELIPKSLKTQLYKAIRDSFASEHGARMTAMHKATDNAKELRDDLLLTYNKARQAAITNEILEIVGGAEALNN